MNKKTILLVAALTLGGASVANAATPAAGSSKPQTTPTHHQKHVAAHTTAKPKAKTVKKS